MADVVGTAFEVLGKALLRIFRSSSDRYVRKHEGFVADISELEASYSQLTDAQLGAKTDELRDYIRQQQEQIIGSPLREELTRLLLLPDEARRPAKARLTAQLRQCSDAILTEAFAVVREASDRHLGVRNVFDDQYDFDPAIFSPTMRQVYDDVKARVIEGDNIHQIELPPEFYAEVRAQYIAEERPPFRFRHFDVQMIGGSVLYEGAIAEMATGEGKTLVATLAAYVVALSGRQVHIITTNDFLAQRDRDWMAPVYEALGLTVGAIQSDMDSVGPDRKAQYACDICYGTNNEFGFDYLRDNMKVAAEDQVQGPLDYAIVDEVDDILIDEARTPLIISGPAHDNTDRYKQADKIARELIRHQREYENIEKQIDQTKRQIANTEGELKDARKSKDDSRLAKAQKQLQEHQQMLPRLEDKLAQATQYYEVEYDRKSAHLTHDGIGMAQDLAGVGSFFVGSNMEWPHLMEQSIRAHVVFEREKEYVVQNNEVVIVDEFTGHLMTGRQWSDGLHQAVEAKEGVTIKEESQTLATITIQNFFKLYQQLAGMTGTAMTEADEFMKIYLLNVLAIPTNKPIIRDDRTDVIYKTLPEKFDAIVDEIYEVSRKGQPVLIGTISVEKSETLSAALTKRYGLDHEVLNAKQHAREGAIIVKAGQQHRRPDGKMWGNITIATNMAGRGVDIKLGPGITELGGLYVLGSERHEARRIDNQLRGRCGRQGDPGATQFFLCFQDDLMHIFAPDWTVKALTWIGWQEGEPIFHPRISKGVEKAQKRVEQRNFESRKSLLEYDEVMDYQRQVFYTRRQGILEGRGLGGLIAEMIDDIIAEHCQKMLSRDYPYECIAEWAATTYGIDLDLDRIRGAEADALEDMFRDHARNDAEQEINVTLGEYMADDIPPDEWDLKGLSKWAMSAFAISISQNHLRKMTPDQVERELIDAATERVAKFDFSRLASFLEKDFGLRSLCEWFNQKIPLQIDLDALTGRPAADIESQLLELTRQAYRRREIEYPVDFILNMSMRRQHAGSGFAARDIADWARFKYRAELPQEDLQELSYDKTRDKLLQLSESFANGALKTEIDQALAHCQWDDNTRAELAEWANERYQLSLDPTELDPENAYEAIDSGAHAFLRQELTDLERYVLLQIYDASWKDHLYAMDHLKGSVGLRGFAEKDPKMEYKREGYRMFQDMLSGTREKVTDIIFKAQLDTNESIRSVWNISGVNHAQTDRFRGGMGASEDQAAAQAPQGEGAVTKTIRLAKPKVGRNDPCPCGSGKKYKKCCGRNP